MNFSPEILSLIASNLDQRADLCTLSCVSKPFRIAAERILYNTLVMANRAQTLVLCELLASQSRLASLVIALTISYDDYEEYADNEDLAGQISHYWETIHFALLKTTRLRFLNIYLESSGPPHLAWILNDCTFQLSALHCELAWSSELIAFLSSQTNLFDLYIADFDEKLMQIETLAADILDDYLLPRLSVLECTFVEAVAFFSSGRPLTHVKTCFSRTSPEEKQAEMALLITSLSRVTRPLRSLNIPDATYAEGYSQSLLSHIVSRLSIAQLRYLGPFVFPSNGKEVRQCCLLA
jgi:hypothetical protein